MADIGIWGLGAIASPAATDRLPLETGVGAGGYSQRGDFFHKNAAGLFVAGGVGEIAAIVTAAARGGGNGYMSIYDPTGRKCYIGYGTFSDSLTLVNEMNGPLILGTNAIYRWQVGASGNLEPVADNTYNIGVPGTGRVKDIFLVNSPTITSDEREKDWRGPPTEAELRAARRIIGELGFYQWKTETAPEAMGADAPLRFSARAQRVRDILADEGLLDGNPARYGLLAHVEWSDPDTGEPLDRYSIDPDQLALFLIAAQEARLAALENLITEGE
jgi:hypothetical protein